MTDLTPAAPTAHPAATEWWRGAVIYQVYPRSYADTDGDGIGDLAGITAHLDHIASLGVDAVWLSPFFTSPMKDFGYDVADYCDVDPVFGTLADFDRLIARAHALGLRIITDLVLAHTSDQHPWFGDSRRSRTGPRADWYVWAEARPDGTPPNNWQSVFTGAAWTWDARRGQYYLHNFLPEQPQLNLHQPAVRTPCSTSPASGWTAASTASVSTPSISPFMTRCSGTIRPPRPVANAPGRSTTSPGSTTSPSPKSRPSLPGSAP